MLSVEWVVKKRKDPGTTAVRLLENTLWNPTANKLPKLNVYMFYMCIWVCICKLYICIYAYCIIYLYISF